MHKGYNINKLIYKIGALRNLSTPIIFFFHSFKSNYLTLLSNDFYHLLTLPFNSNSLKFEHTAKFFQPS